MSPGARAGGSPAAAVRLALEGIAFAVLGLGVRALPFVTLRDGERLRYFGNDAYYHARRALYTSLHFPDVLRVDPYLNFPHGGEPIWPPLFDAAAGALLRAVGAAGRPELADRWLVWIPPLLGMATVVLVWALGRRHLGVAAGRIAAFALAWLPAHVAYTRVGYLDHHAAVALVGAGMLLGAAELAREAGRPRARPRVEDALALALGAGMALALLLWPGMLLEVALVEATLAGVWIAAARSRPARGGALRFAAAHALAFAVVAPFALGREWRVWGEASPVVLSRFQPVVLAAGAALWAGVAASGPRARGTRGRRLAWLAGASGVAAVLALAALGAAGEGFGQALRWLARGERFQAAVSESRPLLFAGGHFAPGFAWEQLTGAVFALPLLAAWAGWRPGSARSPAALAVVAGWAAVLGAITLIQTRFFASLAAPWCLLLGWAGVELARALRRRGASPVAAASAVLALGLGLAAPALASHGPAFRAAWRASHGLAPGLDPHEARHRLLVALAEWIRDHTPETSGWLSAEARPEYAVLSRWTDGHVLEYVARRPTVVTNFGDDLGEENFALAEAYYASPEPRASAILDRLGARYVVLENRSATLEVPPDSMFARLYFFDGEAGDSSVTKSDGRARPVAVEVPAVGRHRLVYETPPKPWAGTGRPAFKLYEHVAGARLAGRAAPGAPVEVRLPVETPAGRRFVFSARARAGDDGRFALRLPYATGSAGAVRTGALEVRAGGRVGTARVTDADVREGRRVAIRLEARGREAPRRRSPAAAEPAPRSDRPGALR